MPGFVKKFTVNFYDYTHQFPADVSALLVSPDGRAVKLMAGAGSGYSLFTGVNLTFSDAAPLGLPVSPSTNRIVSGTDHPSDYLPDEALPGPAPGLPYSTNLYILNGIDPNGPWSLYIYDDTPGDGGGLGGWSLTFEWQTNSLTLQNPRMLGNGVFQAEVWGPPGVTNAVIRTNVIQGSTDLIIWVPILTNRFTNTTPAAFQDIHLPPPLPWRFYRVMQLP